MVNIVNSFLIQNGVYIFIEVSGSLFLYLFPIFLEKNNFGQEVQWKKAGCVISSGPSWNCSQWPR